MKSICDKFENNHKKVSENYPEIQVFDSKVEILHLPEKGAKIYKHHYGRKILIT